MIVAGDLKFCFNPFISLYEEEILAPFNIIGRLAGQYKSVHYLKDIYRRDRPLMFSFYSVEGSNGAPTAEKELSLLNQLMKDMEGSEVVVVGFLWKYTDIWKHTEPKNFSIMCIDELLGIECDVIIFPMWTILHEYNTNRVDIKKALNNVSFAVSRARQEVIIVGKKEKVLSISKEWAEIVNEAKEHLLKIND